MTEHMREVAIRHDGDGTITGWCYVGRDYEADTNEIITAIDPRELRNYRIDGGKPVKVWDDDVRSSTERLEEQEPVVRRKVSQPSKDKYRNAETVEKKCDLLFEILTGEEP